MFLTVHATSGVVIAQATGNPLLGFLAAFISHFILDIIPHGDQSLVKEKFVFAPEEMKLFRKLAAADTVGMVSIITLLYFTGQMPNLLLAGAGIVGAILPDYINAFYIFFRIKFLKWYFSLHYDLHYILNGFTISFPAGLVVQAIALASLLFVIFRF